MAQIWSNCPRPGLISKPGAVGQKLKNKPGLFKTFFDLTTKNKLFMYKPADRYVWDFWLVRDGDTWHIFHLQAPRTLHPDDRHLSATVGQATSTDLKNWTPGPTALDTGPPGTWDDVAIHTGSVIKHNSGRWLMAYTGVTGEKGQTIERIGLAWSEDLTNWTKDAANPVLVSDPRWYEQPGTSRWPHGWRDPFLLPNPAGGWAMLLCVRLKDMPADRAGAVGLATSPDGKAWTAQPPIEGTSGYFPEVEVPHLVSVFGRQHLVFSARSNGPWPPTAPSDKPPTIGTFEYVGDNVFGPYKRLPLVIDDQDSPQRYAGRIFEDQSGQLTYMTFLDGGADNFIGAISDPLGAKIDQTSGRIRLV